MNIDETRALCRWLIKLIPHQQFDDDTPETWQPLLVSVDVVDARDVILEILERERYVSPRDIVQGVRRLRRNRLERAGFTELAPNVAPTLELPGGRVVENPAHRAEKLALRDAIASGRMGPPAVEAYRRGEIPPLSGVEPLALPGPVSSGRVPGRVFRDANG